MAPKNIVISLDGATYSILQNYLQSGQLDSNIGLGLMAREGVFVPSTVITPSLTAPSHIAIATGSTAAENDINANSFHLIKSPFASNISGFGAPIGGYNALPDDGGSNPHGRHAHEDDMPTAEPLWVRLREAGKTVVAATFPGADGATIRLPGVDPAPVLQASDVRTVDYTVPFGAFGGLGARGFSLDAGDFTTDATDAIADLTTSGIRSFSDVKVAELEDISAEGQGSLSGGSIRGYDLRVAAIDTTDDRVVNYNQLIVFDANRGIETQTTNDAPSTGSAILNTSDRTIRPFFFEGSNNVVGTAFALTNLAPDLSTVRLLRTSANYIPRPADNPAVLANVNDINNTLGFWRPQPDFRIAQRLAPGLTEFPDVELEAVYQDLVETFVDYQTDVFLRAIAQEPDADLALGYIEQPDGSGHQFLLTDPRQPTDFTNPNSIGAGQDLEKVERYQDYVLNAYETVNDAVQRVIDAVGVDEDGTPNSNIIITSDHGFAPFHTAVNMNNILANAGFNPNEVRAVTSGPAVNIYINVRGREPDGTVDPSAYRALQQRIVLTLNSIQDANPTYTPNGTVELFDKIYERPVPENPTAETIIEARSEFIGQDSGDVFALLDLGYNFDGFQPSVLRRDDATPAQGQQPIFSVPSFYGAHGYDPTRPEMQAIFLAFGPDFSQERFSDLNQIRSIDIAPTILDLVDVQPAPTIQGESIITSNSVGDLEIALNDFEEFIEDVVEEGQSVLSDVQDALINALDDIENDVGDTTLDDILNLVGNFFSDVFAINGSSNLNSTIPTVTASTPFIQSPDQFNSFQTHILTSNVPGYLNPP